MITIISLGLVFGAVFSFDLFFSAKRQGTFVRQLITLITVSVPAIYNAVFQTSSFTSADSGFGQVDSRNSIHETRNVATGGNLNLRIQWR